MGKRFKAGATPRAMCHGEKGWDSLHLVFVGEDGEEDVVDRGAVLKDAHGTGSAAEFAEAARLIRVVRVIAAAEETLGSQDKASL